MADMPSTQAGQDGAMGSGEGPRSGRPKRRTFTAAYKARIVREYDQAAGPGEREIPGHAAPAA